MKEANCKAQLWKRQEDYEGEITLIFKVPLSDAEEAKKMPTQAVLDLRARYE